MKISIVIPVFNEEDSLSVCLRAIEAQIKPAFEVIVVDNNSTDATARIAEEFNFVKLIKEPLQGVVHARTTGFNVATGDIIARIDADSLIPANWTLNVETVFRDKDIDAVSGVAHYYSVACADLVDKIDLFIRRYISRSLKKENKMYLWGANMAMRRKAWKAVRSSLCERAHQHEDFDIAIHMRELGFNIIFDERLEALVSSRRIDMKFIDYMRYVMMSPGTYAQHGIKVKKQMYPVVAVCAFFYLPGFILYKGYNPLTDKFSLSRLLKTEKALSRVDPTTYVA